MDRGQATGLSQPELRGGRREPRGRSAGVWSGGTAVDEGRARSGSRETKPARQVGAGSRALRDFMALDLFPRHLEPAEIFFLFLKKHHMPFSRIISDSCS